MRITLAPWSRKIIPQYGAGANPASSITFIPLKAIEEKELR